MKYRRAKDTPANRRFMIVALYAVYDENGRVAFCQPDGGPRKPFYRSYEVACNAAVALVSTDGTVPQRPYFCREGGHFHLTSRPAPIPPKPDNRKTSKARKARRKRARARIRYAATAAFERWADPIRCGATREHRPA